MLISALEPILNTLVEDGVFGNVSYLGFEGDDTAKGAQFSSELTFVNLTVDGSTGTEVLPLVVKLSVTDLEARKARNLDAMFHNEVTMYKEILPYLGAEYFYPQLYYGLATNGSEPDKDVLVLENLKYKNFLPSKTKVFLDIDYISIAIKKLAEFHSFSLILKNEDKESFLKLTKKLKSIDSPPEDQLEFEMMNIACVERGIKPLLKDNISVDLLTDCLNFLKHPIEMRNLISYPEESFAVICHGDFCINNILYKFNENDKPIDCVFVDFQFSMYGSPAIDIFFFLYMSTTSELRDKYWDMILKLYWDTLRRCVPNHIIIPSFENFLKHFAGRVIYGYTIAAFFLPLMMERDPMREEEQLPKNIQERIARLTSIGGEQAQQQLSEIVLHLLNKGYIEAFIEFCKHKKM